MEKKAKEVKKTRKTVTKEKEAKKEIEKEIKEVKKEVKVEVSIEEAEAKKKKEVSHYISAVGRRKTSIARIRLMEGKGNLIINEKPALDYFKSTGEEFKHLIDKPFTSVGRRNKFDALIKVTGGGIRSQMGAVMHAVARALDKYNHEGFHRILRKHGLLTRDPRMKERRKFGLMGARKHKSSPKR